MKIDNVIVFVDERYLRSYWPKKLDLNSAFGLSLTDEWLGIDVGLKMSRPSNFWTFPIEER